MGPKIIKIILILLLAAPMALPLACSTSPTAPATPTPAPPTVTNTPANWGGYTSTPTFTITNSLTFTNTPTGSPTPTIGSPTATSTNTPTSTPSNSPTNTFAPGTYTPSYTFTATNSFTATGSITPTFTPSFTPTGSLTATPTNTIVLVVPPYKTGWAANYPNGLALLGPSLSGTIYVAEGSGGVSPAVQLFTTSGSPIGSAWVSYGNISLGEPDGVAVNQTTGNVYVVDRLNSAVYEYTSGGTTITSWSSWSGGAITSFLNPEGIAVDPFGNIFVADTGNDTVEEFTTSGNTVNYVNQWNTGTAGFSSPSAVAAVSVAGPATMLYVADAGNELIQIFDGATWLTPISTVSGADIFGLAVDASGNVYTADVANSLVEEYDGSGALITQWNQSGASAPFSSPDGLLLNGNGDIYVTDFDNGASSTGTVQEFGP